MHLLSLVWLITYLNPHACVCVGSEVHMLICRCVFRYLLG